MCAHTFLVILCRARCMVHLWTLLFGWEPCKAELFCSSCPFSNQSVRRGVLGWLRVGAALLPWKGLSTHKPSTGVWTLLSLSPKAEILIFVHLGTTSEQQEQSSTQLCPASLHVILESLFCSRDVSGLFQAIFNLSLSQQVWDSVRKNPRRPLKTLDQSVWGKKKRKKC